MNTSAQNYHVNSMPALRSTAPQPRHIKEAHEDFLKAKKATFLSRYIAATKIDAKAIISIESDSTGRRFEITFIPALAGQSHLSGGTIDIDKKGVIKHTYTEYQLGNLEDFLGE